MEVTTIFTKVNGRSYKEYFKGSQKDAYNITAQLNKRATAKGFKRHYDGCGNMGTTIKYYNKEYTVYIHICNSQREVDMFRFIYNS